MNLIYSTNKPITGVAYTSFWSAHSATTWVTSTVYSPDGDIVKAIKKAVYLKPAWNPVLSGNEVSTNVLIRNVGG